MNLISRASTASFFGRASTLVAILLASALVVGGCGKKNSAKPAAKADKAAGKTGDKANDKGKKPGAKKAAAHKADKKPAKPQAVLIWHSYRDAERAALDKLISAWNAKHPEIKLTALAIPFDALVDKMQVAIPRGNGPDLIIFAHDKIGTWARDGLIQPLGKWAGKDRLSRFLPQTITPLVFERAIYGLPLAFKSLVLFYNTKMVTKAPATMGELIAEAKKHVSKEDGKFGLAYDAANTYFHAGFLHAYGGRLFDEKSRELKLDSKASIKAAEAVRSLHTDAKILPKGLSSFVVTAMFNDGNVPFVFNGPWFISEIDKSVKWSVAMMPTAPNGQPLRPYLGSEAVFLSAKAKARDAALVVLDYLTSDEAALLRMKQGKQMVANAKIYENPTWSNDPVIKTFRGQADMAVPMSNAVEAGLAWQPYNNALRKVIFGGKPAAESFKAAQSEADASLAKLKR